MREIERKYLVNVEALPELPAGTGIKQGYLSRGGPEDPVVRIRMEFSIAAGWATLTVKGPGTLSRDEFEYPIPLDDFDSMWPYATAPVSKIRYCIEYEGRTWEVDGYAGVLTGLWTAEVELPSEDAQVVAPPWVGLEVTSDPRYSNVHLGMYGIPSDHPYLKTTADNPH